MKESVFNIHESYLEDYNFFQEFNPPQKMYSINIFINGNKGLTHLCLNINEVFQNFKILDV